MTSLEGSWRAWSYPPGVSYPPDAGIDIAGYGVCAADGRLGTVTEAAFDPDGGYVIAETGGWIIATTVMLPAGIVTMIGADDRTVHVDRTLRQITDAPHYDPDRRDDPAYRTALATYYEPA